MFFISVSRLQSLKQLYWILFLFDHHFDAADPRPANITFTIYTFPAWTLCNSIDFKWIYKCSKRWSEYKRRRRAKRMLSRAIQTIIIIISWTIVAIRICNKNRMHFWVKMKYQSIKMQQSRKREREHEEQLGWSYCCAVTRSFTEIIIT